MKAMKTDALFLCCPLAWGAERRSEERYKSFEQ